MVLMNAMDAACSRTRSLRRANHEPARLDWTIRTGAATPPLRLDVRRRAHARADDRRIIEDAAAAGAKTVIVPNAGTATRVALGRRERLRPAPALRGHGISEFVGREVQAAG